MSAKKIVFGSILVAGLAWNGAAGAQQTTALAAISEPSPMPYPSIAGPLAANPRAFDARPLCGSPPGRCSLKLYGCRA